MEVAIFPSSFIPKIPVWGLSGARNTSHNKLYSSYVSVLVSAPRTGCDNRTYFSYWSPLLLNTAHTMPFHLNLWYRLSNIFQEAGGELNHSGGEMWQWRCGGDVTVPMTAMFLFVWQPLFSPHLARLQAMSVILSHSLGLFFLRVCLFSF